jgi:aminoglycoside phosphotransferase (APT) family kinase protein
MSTAFASANAARNELCGAIDEWLRRTGRPPAVAVMMRRSNYATSASVINVHVTLAEGQRLRMVYKRTDPEARLPAARGIKPSFLHDADREIWVYEAVLARDGCHAPGLYASGGQNGGSRWLLLERVDGIELSQVGDRRVWREVAAWLARMHATHEPGLTELDTAAVVRWYEPAFHLRWADRARRFLANSPAEHGGLLSRLAPLWPRYGVVAERLAALPRTIVHGDFNASNILISRQGEAVEVRAVDWEMTGVGPGLIDLAALVSGGWAEAERASMVAAYRHALGDSALARLGDDEFAEALDWCRLALAVQWLGWSPDWSPPPRHRHHWGPEALELAVGLRLLAPANEGA